MKIHKHFLLVEIILLVNIKVQELPYLIQKDQLDFFNSVNFNLKLENLNPGPGKYEEIRRLSN